MKIEVGKRYVRRDGFITPPLMRPDPSYADPSAWAYFVDGVNGKVRYLLGECVYASYNIDPSCTELHEHDLVAEHIDPMLTESTNPDVVEVDIKFPAGLEPYGTDRRPHGSSATFTAAEKVVVDGVTVKDRNSVIDDTLNARGNNYGEFHSQAAISQELSEVMMATPKWPELSSAQREALQMVQHKIARILNGNPLYLDSWVDIVGYAELGKRETERLGGK